MRDIERATEQRIHERTGAIAICNQILTTTASEKIRRRNNLLNNAIIETTNQFRQQLIFDRKSDRRFIAKSQKQKAA